jgi:hypothetical protein
MYVNMLYVYILLDVMAHGRPGKKRVEHWLHSYVQKILDNRATLGEYQPKKGGKADDDVRIGFYPTVIDPALWQQAHEAMVSRRATTDKGTPTGRFGGRTGAITNLFSGLVFNVTDPASILPMHYKTRGQGTRPRLETFRDDGKKARGFDYAKFESAFLRFLDALDWSEILDLTESEDLKQAEEEVASISFNITRAEEQVQKIMDLLIDTPSDALKERLLKTEAQIKTATAGREAAEQRLATLRQRNRDLLDTSTVYSQLAEATDLNTRMRLREEVRKKVARIEVRFRNNKILIRIQFINGTQRGVVFDGDRILLTLPFVPAARR